MPSVCLITAYNNGDLLGRRLAAAYAAGAASAGHGVHYVDVQGLNFDPYAYTYSYHQLPALEEDLKRAVAKMLQSEHLAIFVPVYKTYVPTVVQSFFQLLFATDPYGKAQPYIWGNAPYLNLKTARIISMLDPESWAEFHKDRTARFHPLKKSMLEILGFRKVRTTTIPPVYDLDEHNEYLKKWVAKITELGVKIF